MQITFSKKFKNKPDVITCPYTRLANAVFATPADVTVDGFKLIFLRTKDIAETTVYWVAIGS